MAQCSKTDGNCNLELQGNALKCTTHNSEDIAGKLYAKDLGENFGIVNNNANSGLKEPEVVSYYDGDPIYLSQLGYSTITEFLTVLKNQYKEMATSVAKYRGFYVGRYELGLEGDIPVSKNASTEENKNKVKTADAGNEKTKTWYGLYKKCLEYKVPEINNLSVTSSMIWGSQYDAMLNFMKRRGEESAITSTNNSSKQNNSSVTGAKDTDFIKNIFDLYACKYEWTLEGYSSSGRVIRGTYSNHTDSISNREYTNPNVSPRYFSSRLAIYIL